MKKELKPIPPFKNFILENFPFIEEDFDALTNYELLCHVVNYVKTMGNEFNDIIINIEALNNWFNNLDVQDEINNKLDQMVEDGTLQEIITTYIQSNVAWTFDNINDMKNATNLINGSYARTLGYHSLNDGGGAVYKIRTITNDDIIDEASIIEIETDNSLIAELIIQNNINAKQFSAYGDGIHDDSGAIQKAINYINRKRINTTLHDKNGKGTRTFSSQPTLFIPFGTYKINTPLSLIIPKLLKFFSLKPSLKSILLMN